MSVDEFKVIVSVTIDLIKNIMKSTDNFSVAINMDSSYSIIEFL